MSINITRRQLMAAGTALSCSSLLTDAGKAFAGAVAANRIQEAVQRVTQEAVDSGDIPGVVAQVWHRGQLRADVTAGWFDIERKTPMSHSAIFGIASMTKPVTVALALRALDEGKLKLSDPITRWLPQFA